jgi:amino acid transporter
MLKREIGRWDLVLLLINVVIGAGIFGLPSKIYKLSGFYSLPALFICALIVFVLVLVLAEVGSRFDQTGGPYLYVLTAFGALPAFIIGWLMFITRCAAYAALVNLLVTYLSFFFPLLAEPSYGHGVIISITLLLTYVNYLGVKNSTFLNNALTIIKLLPLIVFIVVGLIFINPELIVVPQHPPGFTDFSSSVLILIFAFTGFEAAIVNTGEAKNTRKNIPFALITSILVVTVFYGLIQFVSIGTLPDLAKSTTPISDAALQIMGPPGAVIITIGAIISIGGTLNAMMLIGSRVPFALSEGKQFPEIFSRLHAKHRTPFYSLLIFSFASLIASLTGSFIYAVSISVISKVIVFLLVCFSLIKLRTQDKPSMDYYRLTYGNVLAGIGIAASLWLLSSSNTTELKHVLIAAAIGIFLFASSKIFKR